MLKRRLILVAALLVAQAVSTPAVAGTMQADSGVVCIEKDLTCTDWVTTPGAPSDPGSTTGGDGPADGDPAPVNNERPRCTGVTESGQEISGTPTGPADPQPGPDSPFWAGHEPGDGAIYMCEGGGIDNQFAGVPMTGYYWAADAPEVTPPDPAVLAQQAIDSMQFEPVDIGIAPYDDGESIGLVGLPIWLWVANGGDATGPLTSTANVGDWSVTATARLDRIEYDMGDGEVVTCHGPGTPYDESYGNTPSPDCGYDAGYQTDGKKTVTATQFFTVTWQGIGDGGTIPVELPSSSTEITIGEMQVLSQ
ncbi:hypothetical protein [Myceligenerans crystallogenes]|uniref:ATP/GTP-binding protein n=1 Tax=Myceligenerans crystallogenes TaxID=316335 RepID=A0ABN2NC19_9MICO